jgi:flagellar basal body-associated protein FliL
MWLEFSSMKWIWIVVLIVVGIVAAVLAFEYLSSSIYHLPTWVPGNGHGQLGANGKPVRGHEKKRGYVTAFIAVVAFASAGWLMFKNMQAAKADGGLTPSA